MKEITVKKLNQLPAPTSPDNRNGSMHLSELEVDNKLTLTIAFDELKKGDQIDAFFVMYPKYATEPIGTWTGRFNASTDKSETLLIEARIFEPFIEGRTEIYYLSKEGESEKLSLAIKA
jgi:hypothetical protein